MVNMFLNIMKKGNQRRFVRFSRCFKTKLDDCLIPLKVSSMIHVFQNTNIHFILFKFNN